MSARAWLNVALLALVAGLAVLVMLSREQTSPEETPRLTDRDPRTVSHVTLAFAAGGELEMLRTGQTWRLVRPFALPANEVRAAGLTRVLAAPVRGRFTVEDRELARYGLAPPVARLALDDDVVLFGTTEPLHGRRYLRFRDAVYLVDDGYFQHVRASPASYVDLAPLAGHEEAVHAIELDGAAVRRDPSGWRLEPERDGASPERLEAFVDAWRTVQATAVRPYRSERPWRGSVTVRLAHESLHFDVARTEFEIILGRRRPGIEYHLIRRVGERLLTIAPRDEG